MMGKMEENENKMIVDESIRDGHQDLVDPRLNVDTKSFARSVDLTSVDKNKFFNFNLSNMDTVDMSNGGIVTLPTDIIHKLENATKIDLSFNEINDTSAALPDKSQVEVLNLSRNKIPHLAINSLGYNKLVSLDLSHNSLSDLPADIYICNSLTNLNISHNQFKVLPPSLEKAQSIQTLDCSNNQISFGEEVKVKLDLESNGDLVEPMDCIYSQVELQSTGRSLTSDLTHSNSSKENSITIENQMSTSSDSGLNLPPDYSFDFSGLIRLTHLDCSDNLVTVLPVELSRLKQIRYLDLANNHILRLPSTFDSAGNLRDLNLANNKLEEIPLWSFQLRYCVKLNLSGNNIGDTIMDLPRDFGRICRRLVELDLRNTNIEKIPDSITRLLDLKELYIGNRGKSSDYHDEGYEHYFEKVDLGQSKNAFKHQKNRQLNMNSLWSLPSSLVCLIGLVKLEASGVNLSDLPDKLGSLRNLKHLDISNNSIAWLPKSFSELPSLEYCDVSNNSLLMLPLDIENISSLRHLLVSYNQLAEIPQRLDKATNLETLDIYHNQVHSLPPCLKEMKGLVRLDIASNEVTISKLVAQTSQEFGERYKEMQEEMRRWNPSSSDDVVRCDLKEEEGEKSCNVLERFLSDIDDDHDSLNDEEGESDNVVLSDDPEEMENSGDVTDSNEESEDWDRGEKNYSPIRLQFKHNLENMHLEAWWGDAQFCPADLHAEPRKKVLERKMQEEKQRCLERGRRWVGRQFNRGFSSVDPGPFIFPEQFNDAEEKEDMVA